MEADKLNTSSDNQKVDDPTTHPWVFGQTDGTLISPYVTLEREGEIGGLDDPRFRRWKTIGEAVVFQDEAGMRSLSFLPTQFEPGGPYALVESTKRETESRHCLIASRSFPHPQAVDNESPLRRLVRPRRNLIVLRAGEDSIHTFWARNLSDEERNWDLCVSWYGSEEHFTPQIEAEYRILQNTGRKYDSLYGLCYAGSPIFDYNYVAFPDDDIDTNFRDLNLLFEIASQHNLALCQPALHPSSFVSHAITVQQPDKRLRFTSFVEVMFPVFSQAALRRCFTSFQFSESSWGLDIVWPKILGGHRHRIGVVDAVPVRHTRPVGSSYDLSKAFADKHRLMQAFAASEDYREYGFLR